MDNRNDHWTPELKIRLKLALARSHRKIFLKSNQFFRVSEVTSYFTRDSNGQIKCNKGKQKQKEKEPK